MKNLIRFVVLEALVLMVINGCSSSTGTGLDVVIGDRCESTSEQVYLEGLYRSDRSECGKYYCWSFIRFFENCTYQSITSTQENPSNVASKVFLSQDNAGILTTGNYSIEGSTIKMKSDINRTSRIDQW